MKLSGVEDGHHTEDEYFLLAKTFHIKNIVVNLKF